MIRFKTNLKPSNFLIDLTPLVDVTFLMLIFFIVTSDILPLKSLNVENPTLSRNSQPLTTQLLVVVDAQNVIYLGSRKEIIDLQTLKNSLQTEIAALHQLNPDNDPTIVLSVDRRVDYGAFLRVFSAAQESGQRIRLVYKPEEEETTGYF